MASLMKILLVSDLHYALKQFDWIHEVAGDYDAIMISGDVLDIVSAVPLQGQLVVILNHLKRLSNETRLFICSGNHDLTGRSEAGEKIARWMADVRRVGIACDGDCIELGEWRVSVCPWWDGSVAREGVGTQLAEDSQKSGQRWLWLYHAPPADSPTSWSGKKYFGDEPLLSWIEQYNPELVLCGHIHQSPFRKGGSWADRIGKTWVFNAGNQIGSVPCHIVFDTETGRATWYSLAGTEFVDFTNVSDPATPLPIPPG